MITIDRNTQVAASPIVSVSLSVIDKITGAGVVHFSPANTSDQLTTYNDKGLYFRTAPPDVLQGRVRLTSGKDSWDCRIGDLLDMPDDRQSVLALEPSVVLLTVAKP